ncbi:juvenile hormone acid O-methyltransferase-like [Musca domestica]|uniref:Juvenile hormone acid O-methyltransferase-like n=1 Tax=Musca domestica TaxID=7370 RepID=A0A1I8MCI8_MUSDO|nr:juvenile hormone acid O-methyltransferase-like [Musca domestica]
MNQPALYHKSHRALKADIGEIIAKSFEKFQWRVDGKDALLDIGSGPGDVLMEHILPLMPSEFSRVVCSDLSEDMVDFARSYYGHEDERCEFEVLDIAMKVGLPGNLLGRFDHITSALCLHWVQDYKTALKNIYNFIRPEGGDCLLIFMSTHNIFDAYNYTSQFSRWSEYMKDSNRCISPLHYSNDPKGDFSQLMAESGFCDIAIDIKSRIFDYGNMENLKENVKSVCGTLDHIPISCHSEFLNDFVAVMVEYAANAKRSEAQTKYIMKYDLIVAYGRKPPTETK